MLTFQSYRDITKAVRFFQRAIDSYEEGLKAYPKSFDLAYNKWVTTIFAVTHLVQ
jgi:hypothetical protein